MPEVTIIGISGESIATLPERARELIRNAEIIFGSTRLLELFPEATAEKVAVNYNLPQVAERIRANLGRGRLVVLASGDPGCFGIASYLNREVGSQHFAVIPALSSVQHGFARLNLNWDDASLLSVHGRVLEEILPVIARARKLALLTDNVNTPARIAEAMLASGLNEYRAYLCEDLDLPGEKVTELSLEELAGKQKIADLNVLVLVRDVDPPERPWGIPDVDLAHTGSKGGLITKLEVRAVSLAKLALTEASIVWDVGAGSGAVSLDAARLAHAGRVYAVERETEACAIIEQNRRRHRALNVVVVCGTAPEGLVDLPQPDAVFIGGSGGNLQSILETACGRLKPGGRLVLNLVTLENLALAREYLAAAGFKVEMSLIQVSRGANIAAMTRFEALSPVYIISGEKDARS
jgi:precorrin-6B C5,15-methyltransferase / cobalt-precorrin-6B C5,C15-methyltransferase